VAYQRREREEPASIEITMGKMRCLHALGEWELLSSLAQEKWTLANPTMKRMVAPLAAAAAWGLGQWELMDNYIAAMKENSPDRSFFGAIAALHQNKFGDGLRCIEAAREGLDTELSALLGESYTRAYSVVVRVQMLAELEEIITYKKSSKNPEKQATMRETWKKRLLGCEGNVETWQRMLKVRALVLKPDENIELWIKFANLCRKSGRQGLAEKSLKALQSMQLNPGDDPLTISSGIPEVTYAQLKYKWSNRERDEALGGLREFTTNLAARYQILADEVQYSRDNPPNPLNIFQQNETAKLKQKINEHEKIQRLLSKCYLKLGQWQTVVKQGDWRSGHVHDVLSSYSAATEYNEKGYKAWHAWALANFEVVTAMQARAGPNAGPLPDQTLIDHVVPAVNGFLKSIALSSSKSTLQDTLRLLTLWFAHGGDTEVDKAVVTGFQLVSVDTWLEVIPQLIARINQPIPRVRQSIHRLLDYLGKAHAQALVYPLTVAMKSEVKNRSQAAKSVMQSLRKHSMELVDQAELISRELIRVAVLWHELWHDGLEEASRLYLTFRALYMQALRMADLTFSYFGDHNVEGMFAVLQPLHDLLDKVC
jgi:FKBP12-rapamycin complex-associated protein